MAKFVIETGRLKGTEIPLGPKQLCLGRGDPGVDVEIPDRLISGRHLLIVPMGNSFLVEDLESRNGTLINNAPLRRALLADGDEIILGTTAMRFDALGAATGPPPPPAEAPAVPTRQTEARPKSTPDI
jgi:pSer/pThr/pTyr-binding forkhead associated (FHA) protein